MRLCDNRHEEVCYEGMQCPVCDELSTIRELNRKVEDLQAEINDHVCEQEEEENA